MILGDTLVDVDRVIMASIQSSKKGSALFIVLEGAEIGIAGGKDTLREYLKKLDDAISRNEKADAVGDRVIGFYPDE